ncbi:preprotein translocase subunit SecG [Porphyromonas sp. COT-290 OH860]|uniref:preprotein translocase subunit SecG n=1 Tax=Porphyromonas sp. COT-290 OH860 TaxID=1515615 RepID=UPI00052D2011|nr:preprotein translocase subunit SecG [Porphyromonas sp. COT-290 OH860]KGN83774.1 preprotein translocase subunit SecG [Porphyromonas sp. COT-290 OH860]
MFYTFLTVLIVLGALALVFIVLIQKSKGGGLASGFASSNNIMGVRKTTDFLEKATWWLFGFVAVLSIGSTAFIASADDSEGNKVQQAVEQKAAEPTALPSAPAFGGEAATAPAVEAPAQEVALVATDSIAG